MAHPADYWTSGLWHGLNMHAPVKPTDAVSIGPQSQAETNAVAIGNGARAEKDGIAIGNNAWAEPDRIVIGKWDATDAGERIKELERQVEKLTEIVNILYYHPGGPGALEAAHLFEKHSSQNDNALS